MTADANKSGVGEEVNLKPIIIHRLAAILLFISLVGASPLFAQGAAKPTPTLNVLRPVAHAVVRETVPIRVALADVPDGGYVGITIDDVFQTARVLSPKKTGLLYEWDTKAAYSTPDDPATPKYVADGEHTIKVDLFDHNGNLTGEATIPIRVANKIIPPAQGIKLVYHWKTDLQLKYLRRSELDSVPATTAYGTATTPIQGSLIHFSRSVEDANGGHYLVRDTVLPKSYLVDRGQSQILAAVYDIKSVYRTVTAQGAVVSTMAPLSVGEHLGFSIPVFANRKVSVGDSWQAPVKVALDWAGKQTAQLKAESRLEDFEWQNGYPCAKVRETYTGPATFKLSPGGAKIFDATTVKYVRVIFLAYGSGRLVHTETTADITADLSPTISSWLGIGAGGAAGGYPGASNPYSSLLGDNSTGDQAPPVPGGYPDADYPGGGYASGGYPAAFNKGAMMNGGGFPGQDMPGMPGMSRGYPGAMPGYAPSGYPGGQYGNPTAVQTVPAKLKVTDITTLQP